MSTRWRTALAVFALVVTIGGVSFRVWRNLLDPTHPHAAAYAMIDFRDAVYYPTVAFFAGDNPYDSSSYVARYPVGERFSLYSPLAFVLRAPIALLGFGPAMLVYYVLSLGWILVLATLCVRWCGRTPSLSTVATLAALLIASRPGHVNLYLGQVTLEAVLATYVALWCAERRPWPAAVALAIASFKGTYGLPTTLLLLARGHHRVVARGLVLALLVTAPAAAWLTVSAGGVTPVIASLQADYASRAALARKRPEHSPFRVDVVALAGRTLGRSPSTGETVGLVFAVLAAAAAGLRRLREVATRNDRDDPRDLHLHATGIALLAIVGSMYHQHYDVLALTLPLVVLVLRPEARPWRDRPGWRRVAIALLALPFANYLSSATGVEGLGLDHRVLLAATSLNAVAILGSLALFVALAFRWPRLDHDVPAREWVRMRSG